LVSFDDFLCCGDLDMATFNPTLIVTARIDVVNGRVIIVGDSQVGKRSTQHQTTLFPLRRKTPQNYNANGKKNR
jgi:hypothetical protein